MVLDRKRGAPMFCKNCGKRSPDRARFCAACGAPVPSVDGPEPPGVVSAADTTMGMRPCRLLSRSPCHPSRDRIDAGRPAVPTCRAGGTAGRAGGTAGRAGGVRPAPTAPHYATAAYPPPPQYGTPPVRDSAVRRAGAQEEAHGASGRHRSRRGHRHCGRDTHTLLLRGWRRRDHRHHGHPHYHRDHRGARHHHSASSSTSTTATSIATTTRPPRPPRPPFPPATGRLPRQVGGDGPSRGRRRTSGAAVSDEVVLVNTMRETHPAFTPYLFESAVSYSFRRLDRPVGKDIDGRLAVWWEADYSTIQGSSPRARLRLPSARMGPGWR